MFMYVFNPNFDVIIWSNDLVLICRETNNQSENHLFFFHNFRLNI